MRAQTHALHKQRSLVLMTLDRPNWAEITRGELDGADSLRDVVHRGTCVEVCVVSLRKLNAYSDTQT